MCIDSSVLQYKIRFCCPFSYHQWKLYPSSCSTAWSSKSFVTIFFRCSSNKHILKCGWNLVLSLFPCKSSGTVSYWYWGNISGCGNVDYIKKIINGIAHSPPPSSPLPSPNPFLHFPFPPFQMHLPQNLFILILYLLDLPVNHCYTHKATMALVLPFFDKSTPSIWSDHFTISNHFFRHLIMPCRYLFILQSVF